MTQTNERPEPGADTVAESLDTPQESGKNPRTAALSSWVGSALEYYDFAVYGTAAALVINHLFFPEDTAPGVAILASMATVGIAYVVRPLGALIMGPLGDRLGRKFVLMLSLFMIGFATFTVGLLPTYEQVGMLAPALLVVCRIIQGISASGEQASAISASLEHADEHRRSWTTSWTLHGTQFGTLLATAVFIPLTFFLTEDQLMDWGWRIPFLLSAPVVLVAWLIRRHLEEPPKFREVTEAQGQRVKVSPLRVLAGRHKTAVIRIAIAALINTVNVVFTVWSLSFATSIVGLDRSTMLWVSVSANGMALLMIPIASYMADRIGRRAVFITGALGSGLAMIPYLNAVNSGNWALIFTFGVIMSGMLYSMANATWPALYAEMLPTPVRVTGLALGTQIGFALSGGLAPAVASIVAGTDGANYTAVAFFVLAVGVLSAGAVLTGKETGTMTLDEIDNFHERTAVELPAGTDR